MKANQWIAGGPMDGTMFGHDTEISAAVVHENQELIYMCSFHSTLDYIPSVHIYSPASLSPEQRREAMLTMLRDRRYMELARPS